MRDGASAAMAADTDRHAAAAAGGGPDSDRRTDGGRADAVRLSPLVVYVIWGSKYKATAAAPAAGCSWTDEADRPTDRVAEWPDCRR